MCSWLETLTWCFPFIPLVHLLDSLIFPGVTKRCFSLAYCVEPPGQRFSNRNTLRAVTQAFKHKDHPSFLKGLQGHLMLCAATVVFSHDPGTIKPLELLLLVLFSPALCVFSSSYSGRMVSGWRLKNKVFCSHFPGHSLVFLKYQDGTWEYHVVFLSFSPPTATISSPLLNGTGAHLILQYAGLKTKSSGDIYLYIYI